MRHTGGGKAAVASDKAKVNGRRREQAEATRIGEDNRDDDEEEKYKQRQKTTAIANKVG